MSFRNEWMMNMFLSLDRMKQGDNVEKWSVLSDGGRGADAIRDFLDLKEIQGEEEEERNRQNEILNNLKKQLSQARLGHLIPVLDQIVANGKNRKLSVLRLCEIWRLNKAAARVKYYRGVRHLTTFISSNKIKGLTHVDFCK